MRLVFSRDFDDFSHEVKNIKGVKRSSKKVQRYGKRGKAMKNTQAIALTHMLRQF